MCAGRLYCRRVYGCVDFPVLSRVRHVCFVRQGPNQAGYRAAGEDSLGPNRSMQAERAGPGGTRMSNLQSSPSPGLFLRVRGGCQRIRRSVVDAVCVYATRYIRPSTATSMAGGETSLYGSEKHGSHGNIVVAIEVE